MTKTRGADKILTAVLLAAMLAGILLASLPGRAYGAYVDPDRACSIMFQLDTTAVGYDTAQKDLMAALRNDDKLALGIKLYKIAGMTADGKYTLDGNFQSVSGLAGIPVVGSGTTAAEWEAFARAAAGNISDGAESAAVSVKFNYGDFSGGGSKIGDLKPGLYLVSVQSLETGDDRYDFVPYITAVPGYDDNNAYAYDVTAGLKPMKSLRPAKLVIRKYLPECRLESAGSTFVFEIKAERDGEVVYNDVQSIVFSEHGMKELTVGNIPSGSTVTVTEVYSGSSYTAREAAKSTAVYADMAGTVEFHNDYNDNAPRNGASAVNHMTVSKAEGNVTLNWEKLSASRSAG